jgi:hypothetical protein
MMGIRKTVSPFTISWQILPQILHLHAANNNICRYSGKGAQGSAVLFAHSPNSSTTI